MWHHRQRRVSGAAELGKRGASPSPVKMPLLNKSELDEVIDRLYRTPTRLDKSDKREERRAQRTEERFSPLSGAPSIFSKLRGLPPKRLTPEELQNAGCTRARKISI